MKIVEASIKDIPIIQRLALAVWPHTFAEIISTEQIRYMMQMIYSTESLTAQIKQGHCYLLIKKDGGHLGYLSYELNYLNQSLVKIHKIYILPQMQGTGAGRLLINYMEQKANKHELYQLSLNVNKYNKAINFYIKMGFSISEKQEIDIGNGFIMDDYVMTKTVNL